MDKLIIVDDDANVVEAIVATFSENEYDLEIDHTGDTVLGLLTGNQCAVILLDVNLGKNNGLAILGRIRAEWPNVNVVMISGEADIATAIKAVRSGAFDFLEKPLGAGKLKVIVKNAFADMKHRTQNYRLKSELLKKYSFSGYSSAVLHLNKLLEKAARSEIPVLLTGENGTGKEIAARRLHYLSDRADMPFVPVNCASIPNELLESELFGHRKGAFTGAISDKEGLFRQANGGTLFLDEIGEMPINLQTKLLRALQEREILRIGDTCTEKIDVRIVSATNYAEEILVNDGRLRKDLYYRLNGLSIRLPALKNRKEDIVPLSRQFIEEYCYDNNIVIPDVSNDAISELEQYDFPGNVRELKNIVQRTIILLDSEKIERFNVPQFRECGNEIMNEAFGTLPQVKKELMRRYLEARLAKLENDKKALARELGMHANNFYRLLREHDAGTTPKASVY